MKNRILKGDALKVLKKIESESIDCVITSPPYWALRDYGVDGQLGLEKTFEEYIQKLVAIFDEVKRVLKPEGTVWVNIGDTYLAQRGNGFNGQKNLPKRDREIKVKRPMGIPEKCLAQIPSRFAIAMAERGWILRNEIIWQKPNQMPSSVKDRFTVDFEKVFFFTKSKKYHFVQQLEDSKNREDNEYRINLRKGKEYDNKKPYQGNFPKSFMVGKRNARAVWTIATRAYKDAHFAVYPEELCVVPIRAGCPKGGIVLDPFMGSGTTIVVANREGCRGVGIELNEEYIKLAKARILSDKK